MRSPRDSLEHQHQKAGLWIAHGAEVVWIVDPDTKTITVHRALEAPVIVRGDERADARPALPGFSMPASDAFAGL